MLQRAKRPRRKRSVEPGGAGGGAVYSRRQAGRRTGDAAELAAAQATTAEGGLILPHGWKYRWRDDRKAYVWLDPKHHVFDTYDKAQRAIERYLARMEDRPEEPAEKARVAAKVSNVAARAPVSKAAKLKSENKSLKERLHQLTKELDDAKAKLVPLRGSPVVASACACAAGASSSVGTAGGSTSSPSCQGGGGGGGGGGDANKRGGGRQCACFRMGGSDLSLTSVHTFGRSRWSRVRGRKDRRDTTVACER